MGKKIYVDFPESKIRVVADLCEETEPEMCEILWNTIKDQPLRMACMHTMSTGHFFDAKIRPSASPVKSGTQANPVGRHKWFLCDLKPGQMLYTLSEMCYLEDFKKAGDFVWNSQFITHTLSTMVVSRKED